MLDGEAEATAGDQRMRLAAGGIALVPATVPHGLPNVGQGTLRIVGFFSSAAVISHFDHTRPVRAARYRGARRGYRDDLYLRPPARARRAGRVAGRWRFLNWAATSRSISVRAWRKSRSSSSSSSE
jgi:hypothetical protein